ncbi:MAG: GntR family transcriptional regulator, partial [Kiritimatiellales bacterium]
KSNLPAYEKIACDLRKKIIGGIYGSAKVLPEERILAEQYNVSRNTVRNALEKLVQDNLIKKIRGRGNVIKQEKPITSDNIVVLTYDIPYQTDFSINTLRMMEETAAGLSFYTIYMHLKDNSDISIGSIVERLNNGSGIYGVVLIGGYTPELVKMLVKKVHKPMILLGDMKSNERSDPPLISQVVGDDYHSYYNPVKYYLERGYKRIAALSNPQNFIWGLAQYRGYSAAFEECGAEMLPGLHHFIPYFRDNGEHLKERLHEEAKECLRKIITGKMEPQILIVPDAYREEADGIAAINNFRISDNLLIVTASGNKQPDKNPQTIICYSDMIAEAFDLLKYENQNRGKVKQRRTVSSHFYP